MGTVDGGMLVSEVQLKWHNCGRWESFWGLVDMYVPFVREFWWGTYGLGTISPQKNSNFGDRSYIGTLHVEDQRHGIIIFAGFH